MAQATSLEDEVTCSICFEVYEDPHILPLCLHTLCLKCMKKLERSGKITCPECRTICTMKHVKKDFKTQRIIDYLKKEKTSKSDHSNSSKEAQLCGMCKENGIVLSCYCEECDTFICSRCHKIHETNRSLKYHTLKSLDKFRKLYVKQIQQKVDELKREVRNTDQRIINIAENVVEVEQSKKSQISDVETFTHEIVDQIQQQEETFKETIKNTNDRLIKNLNSRGKVLVKHKKDLVSKINSLTNNTKHGNVQTLEHSVNHILPAMTEELKSFGLSIDDIDKKMESPVRVGTNGILQLTDYIDLDVKQVNDHYEPKRPLEGMYNTPFHHLLRSFKVVSWKDLKYSPKRLISYIDDKYRCVDYDGNIYEYDHDCKLKKKIRQGDFTAATSLAVSCGDIFVACKENQGLHICHPTYKKIADGSFSSIVKAEMCWSDDRDDIYALEYSESKILLFPCELYYPREWDIVREYKLQHTSTELDRLVAVNKHDRTTDLYTSSFHSSTVYIYNVHRNFDKTCNLIAKKVITGPMGPFKSLLLCDVDQHGNMLLLDYTTHRLVIYDKHGGCHNVKLPDKIKNPIHCVPYRPAAWQMLNRYYSDLCMVTHQPYALVKLKAV